MAAQAGGRYAVVKGGHGARGWGARGLTKRSGVISGGARHCLRAGRGREEGRLAPGLVGAEPAFHAVTQGGLEGGRR